MQGIAAIQGDVVGLPVDIAVGATYKQIGGLRWLLRCRDYLDWHIAALRIAPVIVAFDCKRRNHTTGCPREMEFHPTPPSSLSTGTATWGADERPRWRWEMGLRYVRRQT